MVNDGTAQLELGTEITPYTSYQRRLLASRVKGIHEDTLSAVRADILKVPAKNLLDKTQIVPGSYVNGSGVALSSSYRRSPMIPVIPGTYYAISGVIYANPFIVWFTADNTVINQTASPSIAPVNAAFASFNIVNNGQANLAYDDTAQFEMGTIATAYEPYRRIIPTNMVKGLDQAIASKVSTDSILENVSFNLVNPTACDYVRRYSAASVVYTTDTLGIAASNPVPVIPGEFYCISGPGVYVPAQGGFLVNNGPNPTINITFSSPVTGPGYIFQVPVGQNITHAVFNLKKLNSLPASTSLHGEVQVEHGEMATTYQPYNLVQRIKSSLLPNASSGDNPSTPGSSFNVEAWMKFTSADGTSLGYRFPTFRKHWIRKDKDLCVINTGTSLTARSIEHSSDHPDAKIRPPLMHSRNLASLVWDKIRWEGQQYRRYDVTGFFTETGTGWTTTANVAEWDDNVYRSGLTRYTEAAGASVSFTIPINAWQFNFIHRTDSLGVETATITVQEGNGQLQVFNGTDYVEANGYTFSMREPTPVTRVISIPNPSTGVRADSTIASKGNTTYQKRLKMLALNRGATKRVTITASGTGRLLYWGVEWSPRRYMITYVNAARGSHNTNAAGSASLPRFQDNEVWSFKPDLLFFELPIHNDGAAAAASSSEGTWDRLTENFVFREDYELSMKARASFFGLTPEIGMFTSSISWNFGGIEEDGSLKFGTESVTGKQMTALDKFTEACDWVWTNHPEVVCINAAARWCEAGFAIFGNLKAATEASGKTGSTFTNEGSHWNDTGSKIIAKAVLPYLDFTSQ